MILGHARGSRSVPQKMSHKFSDRFGSSRHEHWHSYDHLSVSRSGKTLQPKCPTGPILGVCYGSNGYV